jgi:hypothetical protein
VSESLLAFRRELRDAAIRRIARRKRRLRLGLMAIVLLLAALGAGITVAATHWLGEPAPAQVVDDFEAYTPQLGFNPDARGARLVARADDISLYATTTRQGTYCTVVGVPWRDGKTMGDGGSCVTRATVAEPIAAGVRDVGRRGDDDEGPGLRARVTLAIVGKVADPNARAVRFEGFYGEEVERAVGQQGFFVAGVEAVICPEKSWTPTFVALDDDGEEIARAAINLIHVNHHEKMLAPTCGFSVGPHGPYDD